METKLLFSTSNKPIQQKDILKKPKTLDYNLEALRGFAALFVVIHHFILAKSPDLSFSNKISIFEPPGHLSVLIFFVLSGYVIGLTNKQRLTGYRIISYLKKRLIRLYPIYLFCVLFTLSISTSKYTATTIVCNLTFTQVLFSKVIGEINPIWSLNYEVLYYVLFIPISFFRINPLLVVLFSLIVGFCNFFLYPQVNAPIVTSYAFGLSFWGLGLVIAKYFSKRIFKTNFTLLISSLFLILSLNTFNVFTTGLIKINIALFRQTLKFPESIEWGKRAITFLDLSTLPYCLMFILIFTGKEFRFKRQLFGLLQLLPAFTFIYMVKNSGQYDTSLFAIHSIYYLLSLLFYYMQTKWLNLFAHRIIKAGMWLGSISYGIYIIHFPLLVLFSNTGYFSGTLVSFTLKFLLFILATLCVSYFLEKKLQPWIKLQVL